MLSEEARFKKALCDVWFHWSKKYRDREQPSGCQELRVEEGITTKGILLYDETILKLDCGGSYTTYVFIKTYKNVH